MKKLLILGGANLHIKLVKAAREMGVYTIVTDYLDDSPAKQIADESWMLNIMDVDAIVEKCEKIQVDAVLGPFLDPCQRPYYEICHRLGVPCYIDTWDQVFALTDKNAFKAACKRNGVDTIPDYEISEKERIEFPVIVKPSNSRSSKGQSVCFDLKELEEGCLKAEKEFNGSRVIIEKYLGNQREIGSQYLVIDGIPHLLWVHDRHPGTFESGLGRVSRGNSYPSFYAEKYRKDINDKVVSLLKNLKIQNGPVMLQGFIDGNTVRFFDMGFRFGGSEFATLFKCHFGIDYVKMLIEYSLTGEMNNHYTEIYDGIERLNGHAGISLFPVIRAGTIGSIEGLSEMMNISGVHSYTLRHNEGDTVSATGDAGQRIAEIIIYGDTINELKKSITDVFSTLRVVDVNGNNMLWNNLQTDELV